MKYTVKYNGLILETNNLRSYRSSVRIIAAMKYSKKFGYDAAAVKFEYKDTKAMKKVARRKLGQYSSLPNKKIITNEMVLAAIKMNETTSVRIIAEQFGVSQSHLNKKMLEEKNKCDHGRLFQQLLCGKL